MSTNGITNAIARLTRAGAEDSRTMEKLKESAAALELYLVNLMPPGTGELPRGYRIVYGGGSRPGTRGLVDRTGCRVGAGADRDRCLMLAQDVAEGWLDEVSAWLEDRVRESKRAAALLESKGLNCPACGAPADGPGCEQCGLEEDENEGLAAGRAEIAPPDEVRS